MKLCQISSNLAPDIRRASRVTGRTADRDRVSVGVCSSGLDPWRPRWLANYCREQRSSRFGTRLPRRLSRGRAFRVKTGIRLSWRFLWIEALRRPEYCGNRNDADNGNQRRVSGTTPPRG